MLDHVSVFGCDLLEHFHPRTGVDVFEFNDSPQSFQHALMSIIDLSKEELSSVGRRGRLAAQSRFLGEVVEPRISHLMKFLTNDDVFGRKFRIALFVQLHDPSRWKHLWPCIQTVLLAAKKRKYQVDVMLTTTQPLETLRESLSQVRAVAPGTLRFSILSHAENRGADIGIFLQQFLLAQELWLESDVIFKVHTKKRKAWRNLMIEPLCGSIEAVTSIIDEIQKEHSLGMVGPTNLTWTKEGPTSRVAFNLSKFGFDQDALREMNFVWSLIQRNSKAELLESAWTIVAGSFYWIRDGLPWEEEVLPMVPKLLDTMGVYDTGCHESRCFAALGLGRIVPTLIATNGIVATPSAFMRAREGEQRKWQIGGEFWWFQLVS